MLAKKTECSNLSDTKDYDWHRMSRANAAYSTIVSRLVSGWGDTRFMGKRDDNGKHREKRETDLFANDPAHQPDDELDLFADLQHDYEALLSHVEPKTDISMHELEEHLEAASAKPHRQAPPPAQASSAALTDHATDLNSSDSNTTTAPLADSQTTQAIKHAQRPDIDASEADDVDGYFAQFSEMANSAEQTAATKEMDESLFDDIPPDPDAEKRTLDHPLWQQPEKTGNRRALAATAIALALGVGGAAYWYTAGSEQPGSKQTTAGDPAATDKAVEEKEKAAIRAALADKILADARAAKELKQIAGSAPASNEKPIAAAPANTAQQLEQARVQLAAEKRNLAAAQGGVADKTDRTEAAVEEKRVTDAKAAAEASAAAEAKRMADAKAAAESKRMVDAKKDAAVTKPKADVAASSKPVAVQQVVVHSERLPTRPHILKKQQTISTKHTQQIVEYSALDDPIAMVPAADIVITPATVISEPASSGGKKSSSTSDQTGEWMIILTSASSDKAARQQVARMHEQGVQAEVTRIVDQGKVFHRIRLTGFSSRQQAQQQLDIVSRKLGLHGAKIEKL